MYARVYSIYSWQYLNVNVYFSLCDHGSWFLHWWKQVTMWRHVLQPTPIYDHLHLYAYHIDCSVEDVSHDIPSAVCLAPQAKSKRGWTPRGDFSTHRKSIFFSSLSPETHSSISCSADAATGSDRAFAENRKSDGSYRVDQKLCTCCRKACDCLFIRTISLIWNIAGPVFLKG